MKMNSDAGSKFSLSDILSKLSKLSFFETIHAARHRGDSAPNSPRATSTPTGGGSPDEHAGGDYCSLSKKCREKDLDCRCPTGDRGRTGAGITGSRAGKPSADTSKVPNLPAGAKKPGLLRHIHNAARLRLPQCFEGAVVSVKQRSQSNWVVGHSLWFSSVSPGGYKFMLSYLDKRGPDALPYFVMEAAPGGQVSCEVRVRPNCWSRAAVVTQVANADIYSFESVFDAYFNSFTTSVIAVNREFIALHYLQQMSQNLAMGAELVARGSAPEMSSASAALRWASKNSTVSATFGNRGLDLCYARVLKPFLTVAAMFEMGFKLRRALATLAYEWTTPAWVVRASIDSDGLVGATLQRSLGGRRAQLACALSALLNHPNNKFRLGFEVTCAVD